MIVIAWAGTEGIDLASMTNTTPTQVWLRRAKWLASRDVSTPDHVPGTVKVDVEGAEYDVLRDVLDLCREGSLSMDTLLVELHLGGALRSAPPKGRGEYALRELAAIFGGARTDCGLLLHAQRLAGGCMNGNHRQSGRPVPRCAVYSWVSQRHAYRAWHAAQKASDGL